MTSVCECGDLLVAAVPTDALVAIIQGYVHADLVARVLQMKLAVIVDTAGAYVFDAVDDDVLDDRKDEVACIDLQCKLDGMWLYVRYQRGDGGYCHHFDLESPPITTATARHAIADIIDTVYDTNGICVAMEQCDRKTPYPIDGPAPPMLARACELAGDILLGWWARQHRSSVRHPAET